MTKQILQGVVLALVPARGGSKGLPGKNLRLLEGVPLVGWAVGAGITAASVDRVICSTDDTEIADAARSFGAEIPFTRPAPFASDTATDLDVFQHALQWLADNEDGVPEFVVQLRPTTPFRDPKWIDAAVSAMQADTSITCMRSVAQTPLPPYKMWRRAEGGRLVPVLEVQGMPEAYNMPRQSLPEVLWHTGQIDVIRSDYILGGSMTGGKIHPIDVMVDTAIDIDHELDFRMAELAFDQQMPAALKQWGKSHAR